MLSKEIRLPKMILFDYGQTLVNERKFDGIKGTAEVMKYAVKNKHNYTAEDVQAAANAINDELGRYDPERSHLLQVEVPNCMFSPYLYESMGIELSLSNKERDQVFWDAACNWWRLLVSRLNIGRIVRKLLLQKFTNV